MCYFIDICVYIYMCILNVYVKIHKNVFVRSCMACVRVRVYLYTCINYQAFVVVDDDDCF